MLSETVQAKLDSLPASPGVYLFHDKAGRTLYVGKARNLRSRVRSYFAPNAGDTRFFVHSLARYLGDITTFVVANEKEAALLENELIKEKQPRYNFKLRDDKDFLSIRIDPNETWPRLRVMRRPKPDGARYFGPYDSATSARQTLRVVNRFFKLRTCRDTDFRARTRPCLQYQIKRCPAPCVLEANRDEYMAQVALVDLFLDGRHDELITDLEDRMKTASESLEYERAAVYRDQLRAVERVRTHQRIATVTNVDQDVLGLFREGDLVEVALMQVRRGHLKGVRTFELKDVSLPDDEVLANFLRQYYRSARASEEILLPIEIEAQEGLADWLSEERGKKTKLLAPKRGPRRRLVEMAAENAEHAFREKAREREDLEARLSKLAQTLRLSVLPRTIECIDISHHAGTNTVAAVTALRDGQPDRKRYRTFRIRRATGGDDFGAMYEALSRRFRRGKEGESGWELPDLFVVDGGKGQLNAALSALKDLDIELPVVALAKERAATETSAAKHERVFLPGQKNAIRLADRSAAHHFLALVRDEAHRVSNRLRAKLTKRRGIKSSLDDIPGVGPKTRNMLLKKLGTLKAIAAADVDKLIAAGASKRQASAIAAALSSEHATDGAADAERAALDNAFEEKGAESESMEAELGERVAR